MTRSLAFSLYYREKEKKKVDDVRLAKILLRLEKGNIELIIFSLYQCFGLE